jgi:hypothetical protein
MKAASLAFYFICINLSIAMVNATGVFDYSQATGENFRGEDWDEEIEDFKDPEKSFIREDANAFEEVTGLAMMVITGINQWVKSVLGAIAGIGALMTSFGLPSYIGTNIDRLTILIYIYSLLELKTGRGET